MLGPPSLAPRASARRPPHRHTPTAQHGSTAGNAKTTTHHHELVERRRLGLELLVPGVQLAPPHGALGRLEQLPGVQARKLDDLVLREELAQVVELHAHVRHDLAHGLLLGRLAVDRVPAHGRHVGRAARARLLAPDGQAALDGDVRLGRAAPGQHDGDAGLGRAAPDEVARVVGAPEQLERAAEAHAERAHERRLARAVGAEDEVEAGAGLDDDVLAVGHEVVHADLLDGAALVFLCVLREGAAAAGREGVSARIFLFLFWRRSGVQAPGRPPTRATIAQTRIRTHTHKHSPGSPR